MIKFLHTADLHIGKSRTFPDYLERQELMLDGIYKVAASNKIKLVLMAGDIFESKHIKWNEQMLFIRKLFEYDSKGFTSVLCNGNHDELETGVSHLWLPSMIQNYGGFKNTYIIDSDPKVIELEELSLAVIPVVNNNMSTQELEDSVEAMYNQTDGSKPFVVMLHATISGANTDIGYNISGGPRIPDLDFVAYWAAGDIHKCFPPDVQVMIDYDKSCSIKDIVTNDSITHVLSYNLKRKRIEKQKILNKRESLYAGKFTRITLEDGNQLKSTHDHKYIVVGRGEVNANALKKGDKLIGYHGEFNRVYPCSYCNNLSHSSKESIGHSKTHDPLREPYNCHLCDEKFNTRELKGAHFQVKHPNYGKYHKLIKCEDCGEMFKERHMGAHKFFHSQESLNRNNKIRVSLLDYYKSPNGIKNKTNKRKNCELHLHRDKIYKIRDGYNLSKGELFVNDLNIKSLTFTGNSSYWVAIKNKDGSFRNKNPDFIVGNVDDRKNVNKFIEVFGGMGYFHTEEEICELTESYERAGYQCLIIDDRRLSTKYGREQVRAEVEAFCNNSYVTIADVQNFKRKTKVPNKVYSLEVARNHNFFAVSGKYPLGNRGNPTLGTPVLVKNCQQIAPRAWYSGSPIQHNFGDAQPKGVLTVELTEGEEPKVELVELKGIKPLVTIKEKPEKWPEDCYIRYLGPLEEIIELPSNVIKTEGVYSSEKEKETVQEQMEFTDSIVEGLEEFLTSKEIPEDYRKEGIEWVMEKYNK